VQSDPLAGTLISGGAAVALVGMALSGSFAVFLVFMSFLSFSLVFLFGLFVARKGAEAPALAVATLWFATIGGLPFLWLLPFFQTYVEFGWSPILASSLGLLGTAIAIVGAGLELVGQRGPGRSADPRWFRRAAWLLGVGSLALLVAAAVTYPGLPSSGYMPLVWMTVFVGIGLWVHLAAWIALCAATRADFRGATATSRLNRGRLVWTLSVLSFIGAFYLGGLFRIPFFASWYPYPFLFFFVPFLPYNPAVFAPVVLCHAFIFHRYSRFLPEGVSRRTVTIGVVGLVAAAIGGLVGLSAYSASADLSSALYWWVFLPFPAGSTAIGYGLVFRGWQGEPPCSPRARGALLPHYQARPLPRH
jgi:hypothetical protein